MDISSCYLMPKMPDGLQALPELALNMRWCWNHAADELWSRLDPALWQQTGNPWLILLSVSEKRLQALAADGAFRALVEEQASLLQEHRQASHWFGQSGHAAGLKRIAYFSMEFGLSEALPLYSGGLGILAGDCLKTASDLGVPLVGVGLLYQQGYFRQVLDATGSQQEFYPYNDPVQMPVMPVRDSDGEWLRVSIPLPGRTLRLQVWQVVVGRTRLYLLDSNDPLNSPADRGITSELYGGGPETRLQQEMVLGIGGWRVLEALGEPPEVCHLNEGHAAFAILERAGSFSRTTGCGFEMALTATRAGNLFTTHTPVEAGFDRFQPRLLRQYLDGYCREELGTDVERIMTLGRSRPDDPGEPFNMAWLALRGTGGVNAVSQLHGEVSRGLFQPLFPRWPRAEVPVGYVTNGVHVPSWDSAAADAFWTASCGKPRWLDDLATTEQDIRQIPDADFWALRTRGRKGLIDWVRSRLSRQVAEQQASRARQIEAENLLDPNTLTLCFSRRFTGYKRPNLLLQDAPRLARLLGDPQRPVQIILAGKAHPRDEPGKAMIRQWTRFIEDFGLQAHVVFVSDYDIHVAERLVQGADVWVNTPRRPWEACGTSGMKVLVNGGLNLSELDGWWAEAWHPEVGWALGDRGEHGNDPAWDAFEAGALYRTLEQEVIPCFYERDVHGIPRDWVARMRASMAELTPRFSANRMLREYVERLYVPLAEAFRARTADGGRLASGINAWQARIARHWRMLHFGDLDVRSDEQGHHMRLALYLDDLDPELVAVELFAEGRDATPPEIHAMRRSEALAGAVNGFLYTCSIAAGRPAGDYTARVRPLHPDAAVPLEEQHILWQR